MIPSRRLNTISFFFLLIKWYYSVNSVSSIPIDVDIKYEWENTDFTEFPEHP